MRNATDIARNFYAERFAVIIDDVAPTTPDIEAYISALKAAEAPVHVVTLMASLEDVPGAQPCQQVGAAAP